MSFAERKTRAIGGGRDDRFETRSTAAAYRS
jgi:hypothetical protein